MSCRSLKCKAVQTSLELQNSNQRTLCRYTGKRFACVELVVIEMDSSFARLVKMEHIVQALA